MNHKTVIDSILWRLENQATRLNTMLETAETPELRKALQVRKFGVTYAQAVVQQELTAEIKRVSGLDIELGNQDG